jgi:hypothetical protein
VSTRIDSLLAAATLAHEVVFDLSRDLSAEAAGGGDAARALLSESARIATIEMPGLARRIRMLNAQLDLERLAEDPAADRTARGITAEEARVVPRMEAQLTRLREIVDAFRRLLDGA